MYQPYPPSNAQCTKITIYVFCVIYCIGGVTNAFISAAFAAMAASIPNAPVGVYNTNVILGLLWFVIGVIGLLGACFGNKTLLYAFVVTLGIHSVSSFFVGIFLATKTNSYFAAGCFVGLALNGLVIYCAFVQIKAAEYPNRIQSAVDGSPSNALCTKVTIFVFCGFQLAFALLCLVTGAIQVHQRANSDFEVDYYFPVFLLLTGILLLVSGVIGIVSATVGHKLLLIAFIVLLVAEWVWHFAWQIAAMVQIKERPFELISVVVPFVYLVLTGVAIYCAYVQIKAAPYRYRFAGANVQGGNFPGGKFPGNNVQGGNFQDGKFQGGASLKGGNFEGGNLKGGIVN